MGLDSLLHVEMSGEERDRYAAMVNNRFANPDARSLGLGCWKLVPAGCESSGVVLLPHSPRWIQAHGRIANDVPPELAIQGIQGPVDFVAMPSNF